MSIFRRPPSKILFCVSTLALFSLCASAASGDLDPSFARVGKTRIGFGDGFGQANAVAGQPDGKIVVAADAHEGARRRITVIRYNPDGSLDQSFNGSGMLTVLLDGHAAGLTLQDDGKILLCGSQETEGGSSGFLLMRLNPDGTLDSSFGPGGKIITKIGAGAEATALAIQADNKIVLVGTSSDGAKESFTAVRYNPDGSLDNSFDGDGIATIALSVGSAACVANALTIQPDGKLLLAGYSGGIGYVFTLVRFLSDGSLDSSLGGTGFVMTDFGNSADFATAVAIQFGNNTPASPDKIVVAGYTGTSSGTVIAVARFLMNGALDTSFDGDGKLTGPAGWALALRITGFGFRPRKIIVGGWSSGGFTIVQYNANGTLDTSFDGDGIATSFGGDSGANAMTITSGLVLAGSSSNEVAVARYNFDGSLDTTFNGSGTRADPVGFAGTATAHAIAIQSDGGIVVAGELENRVLTSVYSDFALLRLTPDGFLDPSFGTAGKIFTPNSELDYIATALAIQPDGKIIAAGNPGFIFRRYHTNGVLELIADAGFGMGTAVALQADGKILMAGSALVNTTTNWDFAVARFNSNGLLDSSFDGDGRLTTSLGSDTDRATAIALQPDGKILVAGTANFNFALVRYNSDGSLDTSFDHDGKVTTIVLGGAISAGSVASWQGRILLAGTSSAGLVLLRYNSDGSLDTSFGNNGMVIDQLATGGSMAIQSDGKILVAGGQNADFAVLRFNTDGSLDATYGTAGRITIDVSGGTDQAAGIALDSNGKAVVAGTAEGTFGITRLFGDVVPRLTIARGANNVAVSWPNAALGFLLQSKTNFSESTWADIANTRTTNRIIVANPTTSTFYRLKL